MMDTPKADLSEAMRLLDAGLHLVRLKQYSKQPLGNDWNAPSCRARSIDPDATGYGVPLALNHACSVDPDNWHLAVRGMAALGFDLERIMAAGVRTKSTRPGSGGRAAFAEEPDLSWLRFSSRDPSAGTIIEFRAGSPNLQDVVPGLIYFDKAGNTCTQAYANDRRWDDLPGLPDELLNWWQRCSTDIEFLRDQQAKFFAAIESPANLAISTGRGGSKLAFEAPGYRGRYNAQNSVESVLSRHAYTWHPNLQRWAPPTATGAPGVRPIPGRDGLWQSDHASDPLAGTFDAWVAHVVLDHYGDVEAAKRAMVKNDFDAIPITELVTDPETGEILPPSKPALTDAPPHISTVQIWSADAEARIPEALLTPPHPLLQEVANAISKSAETTDKALNVAGAVHLAAVTVARMVESNKANHAALFLGIVARSGAGKNASKNFVARCLDRAFGRGVVSNFSSGSGLYSALKAHPAAVMHLDEFGDKLGHGLKDRAGSTVAKGFSDLKEIYSQTGDRLSPATFSLIALSPKSREEFIRNNGPIHKPHLNILAVTTPGQLNDAVTQASVEGGLINRFLFVSACGQVIENEDFQPQPPEWLITHMQFSRNGNINNSEAGNLAALVFMDDPETEPHLRQYSFCDESMAMLNAYKAEIKRLGANDEFMADMSQRWRENAMRMALALHSFCEPTVATISPAITQWCIDYTRFYGRQFARRLLELATPMEHYGRRRKEYLLAFRAKPEGVTSNMLGKYAPWRNDPASLRTSIVTDMLAAGDIAVVMGDPPARGPAPKLYVALA